MSAQYTAQLPADQTPLDALPIPLVTPASAETEDNPFKKKPSRLRAWLKKPSREFWMRSAVAALAATIGWGVGAQPWKPAPRAPVVARAALKKPVAAKPVAAKPPAGSAVRRVALAAPKTVTTQGKAPTTVARAQSTPKAKSTTTAKAPASKVASKPVASKPVASKPVAKKTAVAKTTAGAKATTKPKVAASSSSK